MPSIAIETMFFKKSSLLYKKILQTEKRKPVRFFKQMNAFINPTYIEFCFLTNHYLSLDFMLKYQWLG